MAASEILGAVELVLGAAELLVGNEEFKVGVSSGTAVGGETWGFTVRLSVSAVGLYDAAG